MDIKGLRQKIMTLSPERIYKENRCLKCFRESAEMVNTGKWKKLSDRNPRKMWYQILDDENRATKEIVTKMRPRRVLEIGCGPGRIIDEILSIPPKQMPYFERIIGIEQNHEIYNSAFDKFLKIAPNRVVIREHLFGDGKGEGENNRYSLPFDDNYFDLAIAVSNIVGWQKDEVKWICEVLRVSEACFFTVYRKKLGNKNLDNERMKMYKGLGCEAYMDENENIWIKDVDAFGKDCVTRSYSHEDIVKIIKEVSNQVKNLTYQEININQYMYGFLLTKT